MSAERLTFVLSITTNTFTMYYTITFKDQPSVKVWSTGRADAIKQACRQSRGYLSMTDQRRNVVSAKISKVQ
jgi:hypothetical protein